MSLIRITALLSLVACGSGRVLTDTGQPRSGLPSCLEGAAVDRTVEGVGEHRVPVGFFNGCDGIAQLGDVRVRGGGGAFTVPRDFPSQVDAGGQATIDLLLNTDTGGVFEAVLEVEVIDADPVEVPVRIQVSAPRLTATVEALDFGEIPVGCDSERLVRVRNQGDRPGTLGSVELQGDLPVTLVDPPSDLTLASGENVAIPLVAAPMAAGPFSGLLVVRDASAAARISLPISGRGTGGDVVTDEVTLGVDPVVDVLFTIDRSGCSDDFNQGVADHIDQVLAAARAADADLHLAATVADGGCIVGDTPYIDTSFSASAATEVVETMIDLDFQLASYGANTERGFSLAVAALSSDNTDPGGCNDDWHRDDAFLQIVHVSDEPEQSVFGWNDYLTQLDELHPGGEHKVHAVAGDYPSGCAWASGGAGYYEAVIATDGSFTSLCQPPEDFMAGVADGLVFETAPRLALTRRPVLSTLVVRADRDVLPASDWVLDEPATTIRLADGVELPTRTVLSATYVPAPDTCP